MGKVDGNIEYKVNIGESLSGDILLGVTCNGWGSFIWFPPYGDISLGLERLGIVMRRHFDSKFKDGFLVGDG